MKKLSLLGVALLVAGCIGFNQPDPNEFKAPEVSNITVDTSHLPIKVEGKLSSGSAKVRSCVVYYSKNSGISSGGAASTTAIIENDRFYVNLPIKDYGQSYACAVEISNGYNTVMSKEKSFSIREFSGYLMITPPVVASTAGVDHVTVSSNVSAEPGVTIAERGVLVSTDRDMTAIFSSISAGSGTGPFDVTVGQIMFGTQYFVQAYVKDGNNVAYSAVVPLQVNTTPTVTTSDVSDRASSSVVCGGIVTSDGGAPVTARGVVWSTSPNPTIFLSTKTNDGTGTGAFTSTITGLSRATSYYYRAYAKNEVGTFYGVEKRFTTLAESAVVTTSSVSAITSTTATCGGNVTDDGGASVTARGVVWSTSSNPTVALSTKTVNGSGTGSFTSSITGLSRATTYYVRAYATTSAGTVYGTERTFTTSAESASVTTSSVTSITSTSATCGGNVTDDGGASVTARGVVWSTSSNPTVALSTKTVDGSGTGSFTSSITGLSRATTYYVRAYVTTSIGTVYGEQKSFTTSAEAATVTTTTATSITSTSAVSGGNVTDDGGASVTARGVVWSTSWNPTVSLSTKTTNGSGTGNFTSSISGLSRATTYYVRAYATTSKGTFYGDERTFTTQAESATVTTSSVSSITSTSATCGGNVTDDGGALVTARGVVWSTSSNPTVALSTKTVNGTGTGSFTSSITGLAANTTYYVRAYATNERGTVYGEQKSFTTKVSGNNEGVGTGSDYNW